MALDLWLPNLTRIFNLFVTEKNKTALEVLTHWEFLPWKWLVVDLPKQLDLVAAGWPPCPKLWKSLWS